MLLFWDFPGSVRDVIDSRLLGGGPPLGEVEALIIFAGVCRGVAALHQHEPPWAHRRVDCVLSTQIMMLPYASILCDLR